MKALSLFFSFIAACASHAAPTDYSGSLKWSLGGESYREEEIAQRGDNTSFFLGFRFERNIKDWALVKVAPGFKYASGSGQGLIHDDRPRNSFFASEAKIQTLGRFSVQAGAIGQSFLHQPAIVSPTRSFPGLMGSVKIVESKRMQLGLSLQSAIPTTYSYSTQAEEREATPSFQTALINYTYSSKRLPTLTLSAMAFEYGDLPQIVAVESADQGNSVTLTSSETGQFDYAFAGYGFSGLSEIRVAKRMSIETRGHYAINSKAEDLRNKSYYAFIGGKYRLSKDSSILVGGYTIRRESDIAPSEFNYGRVNNRVGGGLSAEYQIDSSLKIKGLAEQTTPIFQSDLMSDRNSFSIKLESNDVLF